MQTKDAIKFALTVSNGAVLSVIEEMKDAATTFPTPNGGCHPLWVLGHLTLVEGMIPAAFFAEKNPAAEWQQYFGENSEPVADPSAYPPFAEVREKYRQLREQNLKLLESLSDLRLRTVGVWIDPPTQPVCGSLHMVIKIGIIHFSERLTKLLRSLRLVGGHGTCRVTKILLQFGEIIGQLLSLTSELIALTQPRFHAVPIHRVDLRLTCKAIDAIGLSAFFLCDAVSLL